MADRKKKRVPLFWLLYFSFVILFILALFSTIVIIKGKLIAFEESRPERCMEDAFYEYFTPGSAERLIEKSGFEPTVFEKGDHLKRIIEDYLNDAEYYSVSANGDGEAYAVKSDDVKFAVVNIAKTGEIDQNGYNIYTLDSIKLLIGGSGEVSIRAPKTDTVYINGVKVDEMYVTDAEYVENINSHLPEGTEGISILTYKVTGLMGTPSVTATDMLGNKVTGITCEDEVFYTVPVNYLNVPDWVRDRALAAGESYAAYMQADASFGEVAQYIDPSSLLYTDLLTSDTQWANPHDGYVIENPAVSEYYVFSEDIYSCRITFTHVLKHPYGDYRNDFDMTFYYRLSGDTYVIYDSMVN